jgi:hypothetical protein
MGLNYYLELVDQKHRYGSNLRPYHAKWQEAKTLENFFYWLDEGEGRKLDLHKISRRKLDSECVRYLSREERRKYLVKIDHEGRLYWATNGARITTSLDSVDTPVGILHRSATSGPTIAKSQLTSQSSISPAKPKGEHRVNNYRNQAKPPKYIFVADISFNLYIGIKQTGTFQHSSFLQGARILAAGVIQIENGQLRKLSPLSGHYRPPSANFRAFVHALREAGVDLSRVSISKSYATLVGRESYYRIRRRFTRKIQHVREVVRYTMGKKQRE